MQKIKTVVALVLCVSALVAIYNAKFPLVFGPTPKTNLESQAAIFVLITRLIIAAACLMAAWLIRPQRRSLTPRE